jgi:heterodisulfide reductase subunit A
MVNLKINGKDINVEQGTTILEAAVQIGLWVPTLCQHDLLQPAGACRLCIVEQKRGEWSSMVTSCSTPVVEGSEIFTDNGNVQKARQLVLGLLLSRWPNVPVLLDLAEKINVQGPLFVDDDYTEPEADACIRCGMCIRVCNDVVGAGALSWGGRGTERMVTTPFHKESEECIACGSCAVVCPTGHITMTDADGVKIRHDEILLGPNSAIALPTMQAIPNAPYIDTESCIHFKTGECKICEDACEPGAINFDQVEEEVEIKVGAVVMATGAEIFDASPMKQYGYGKLPNVISSLEFEKMNCASGSTGGKILCANGEPPKSVAILHCIGSRDKNFNEYCSRVCCMYALKFAHLVKEKTESEVYDLYIDMRCPGKGYEEFYDRLLHEDIRFIRGKGAEISNFPLYEGERDKLIVRVEDTLTSSVRRIPADMVVLCNALKAPDDAKEISRLFGVSTDKHGWMIEKHPKLAPVETASDGVFIAGCAQGPKDIPDTVAQGSAAASMVLQNILKGQVELDGFFAVIDEDSCSGCRICNNLCPYGAIVYQKEDKVSSILEALCKSCGTCVSACPSGSIVAKHFTDDQLLSELEGVLL